MSITDSTIDTLPIWTIEPAVAIVCACLPVLRPLFVGALDKKKSSGGYSNPLRSYPKKREWTNVEDSEDSSHKNSRNSAELRNSDKDMHYISENRV